MTEQAFINKCSQYNFWNEISVLIVDEAHERNLNTDIVLGLSKLELCKRNDLHVVVASATIEPA
jgi:HrpA-like RNA helicase